MAHAPNLKKMAGTLRRAVRMGDAATARRLLDAGVDVNTVDGFGLSVLIWAARRGHPDVCELLVQRGADVNGVDRMGGGPLRHAVAFNRAETVKRLIDLGADIEHKDRHEWTAYGLARSMNHFESCRVLLAAGAKGDPPDSGSLSIGCITGADTSLEVDHAMRSVEREVDRLRAPNPWHERGHLNLVICVASAIWSPDYFGVRRASFSRKKRVAVVTLGMRDERNERQTAELIVSALAEAWFIATPLFKRAGIPFDSENVRSVIESIAKAQHMHHVLAALRTAS